MVTWDERKRLANIAKHGLDFDGCEAVFDSTVLTAEDERNYGEHRINLIGWLNGCFVHMTYTERGEALHVISLRRATHYEIELFHQAFSAE